MTQFAYHSFNGPFYLKTPNVPQNLRGRFSSVNLAPRTWQILWKFLLVVLTPHNSALLASAATGGFSGPKPLFCFKVVLCLSHMDCGHLWNLALKSMGAYASVLMLKVCTATFAVPGRVHASRRWKLPMNFFAGRVWRVMWATLAGWWAYLIDAYIGCQGIHLDTFDRFGPGE